MEDAWLYERDEFVIDPIRVTMFLGKTGVDGDTFKNEYLMDKYGIQINKTSRNTVLFMTNIGTSRSSIAYLIEGLLGIARELDWQREENSAAENRILQRRIKSLTHDLPPLPDFSDFTPPSTARYQAIRPKATSGRPISWGRTTACANTCESTTGRCSGT